MRLIRLVSSSLAFLGLVPTILGPAAPVESPAPARLLVTVGEVESDRALLWVRADEAGPLSVHYGPSDDPAAFQVEAEPDPARDLTARIRLDRLRPGTRYAYTVIRGGDRVAGHFGTAAAPEADVPVRLVWSGDLGGSGYCRDVEDGYRIFRPMAERRPDFFVFVGDTIYADRRCGLRPHVPGGDFVASTLSEFHAKHRYNRADPLVQQFARGIAVYAIWDDHEVRNNFAGSDEALMAVGLQAFVDYWPVVGPPEEPARLYRSVRWGKHLELFILDTRQYRSANRTPDGPGKTMLGEEQRRWLLTRLPASEATWKVVVTSVPLGMFTGRGSADAWSSAGPLGFPRPGNGFVHERDLILETLRARGVRNLVFLTGEVHHGELVRHEPATGWVIHEFTAGPLAARPGYPLPLDRSLRSRSLGSLGLAHNFGELVVDSHGLQARIVDAAGATRASVWLVPDGQPAPGLEASRQRP